MASAGAPVPAFPSGLADLYFVITGESANPEPTCCSSVLFLPGIEGSALKEGDNVLWPPNFWSQDVARLELTDVGESVNDIKVVGVLGNFYPGTNLYGGFASFMDELATVDSETGTSTIEAWVPFAYDWRYSPGKILEEGVSTPDGVVDLVATVEALAENSKSEKVTIVAHSMGGLLGKALIKELQDQGKEGLIDAFVMVGTPQLGTPQGVATLLHGDQPIALEFFVRSHALRAVAQNMQSAYDLLPSESYFEDIVSPVVSFDPNASFTQAWRDLWLGSLDTYDEFREFLTGVGVVRVHPEITNLGDPEVLDPVLLSASRTLHNELDDYEIPTNVRVVQVAGWGLPTIKTVMYWNTHLLFLPIPLRGYKGVPTVEGDDTVVYPSAVSLSTKASHFFNLASFNAQENTPDYTHKDLLNADQVQQIVEAVVRGTEVTETTYVRDERPDVSLVPEQLLIITRSPVILGVRDGAGHFTGIDSEQDLNSETLLITKDIPGSSVLISGEDQYIFLPKEGTYTFEFKGTGTGPATVETATFSNDTVVPIATYTDIPVTPDTEATFTVDTNVPEETFIQVDTNGNGVITPVPPDGYVFPPTLGELIASLKLKIQSLDVKQKLKDKLLKKVEKLEKKIAKNKLQRASKVVMNLEAKVIKKVGKGKISDADAQDILDLLDAIENAL
jgi:pimeloyl-ACP methyl ester carboxylesterase